ncbi:MAG TPA: amidase [Burkholderiaceae bacterium]|nr:amidase [Burkholderiaceae bacterium]
MPLDPFAPLTDLAAALASGATSALALVESYLERIRRLDPALHAYVHVDENLALRHARAADERLASGVRLGPLDGVPIALKDLLEVEGFPTGVGSALWKQRTSRTTAVVVRHLLAAGMVPLGKTHMVEFAFGTWGANPQLGTPWNPWDLATHRVPGGSSSGSGVAVAAGLAPAAIGSDTGGSVRIPAALNGITGLKTSGGLVSTEGAFPLSTTLDTIGPMTRSAADAALLCGAMLGDGASARAFAALAAEPEASLAGVRITRLPADQFPIAVEPDVLAGLAAAARALRALGAVVIERRFPFDFDDLMRRNGQLIAAEAYAVHRAYIEDERLPIGPGVRRRVLGGKAIAAADYIDALAHRGSARARWIEWMQACDALLAPAVPMTACPLEAVDETVTPLASFTRAGNYLDTCALSLPAGFSGAGLPVGVQLLGQPGTDTMLLRIGMAFQRATDWHRRTPDLAPLRRD